jgi:hypothetical protein
MIDCLSLGCEVGATTLSIRALCILTLSIALKSVTLDIIADIFACLLDLNFKQSKLTRINFYQKQAYFA